MLTQLSRTIQLQLIMYSGKPTIIRRCISNERCVTQLSRIIELRILLYFGELTMIRRCVFRLVNYERITIISFML